jgi:protein-tyrosine phosphatase
MPSNQWPADTAGLFRLPSGRLVRGRGLRRPVPPAALPTFGVYLLARAPAGISWPHRWVECPDFRTPRDRVAARAAFAEALERASSDRVEIACGGGRGRTGTALACLAVLDGVPAGDAVRFVRDGYDRRAVETPWQRRYVERFG